MLLLHFICILKKKINPSILVNIFHINIYEFFSLFRIFSSILTNFLSPSFSHDTQMTDSF